jgi:hypothetical protein
MPTVEGGSRHSMTSRQGRSEGAEPRDLPGPSLRPLSVRPDTKLRDEARAIRAAPGEYVPFKEADLDTWDERPEIQARPVHRVLDEWEEWVRGYHRSHIEYESPDGEPVRQQLENSYMESYGDRYYARMKDFERGVKRQYDRLTTVMLTFTASSKNADGEWRCPADHMRDVMNGWKACRKQLHQALEGLNWEYVRILEPHKNGYGHLHVGVFVEIDELEPERFEPVLESHVRNCRPAGSDAHSVENAVSVNGDGEIDSIAGYLSEYIGLFGEIETVLDRPIHERLFYSVTWATQTRRLDFSNGAQDIISGEEFRRETGLRPCDRGAAKSRADGAGADGDADGGDDPGWSFGRLCAVSDGAPSYYDPDGAGVRAGPIDGRPEADPPPYRT